MVNRLNALVVQAHTEDLRRTAENARAAAGYARGHQAHARFLDRLAGHRASADIVASDARRRAVGARASV